MAQAETNPVAHAAYAREAGFISKKVIAGVIAGVAAAGTGIGFAVTQGGGSEASGISVANNNLNLDGCNDITQTPEAATSPSDESLLQASDVSGQQAVIKTEQKWFADGPIGNKGDLGVEAAMYALTAKPAHADKNDVSAEKAQSPDVLYRTWFENALASGDATAMCKSIGNVLIQDTRYGNFASAGASLIKVVPVKNANNGVTDINLVSYSATKDMTGLIIAKSETSKGEQDYNEVLVDENGQVFVKASLTPQPTKSNGPGTSPTPSVSPSPENNQKQSNQSQKQQNQSTGGSETAKKGTVKENKTGTQTGTSKGTKTGTKTGNNNSPQGGGGGSTTSPTTGPGKTASPTPGPGTSPTPGPSGSPSPSPSETPTPTPKGTDPGVGGFIFMFPVMVNGRRKIVRAFSKKESK